MSCNDTGRDGGRGDISTSTIELRRARSARSGRSGSVLSPVKGRRREVGDEACKIKYIDLC
jgi:hypothetical protein